VDLVVKQVADWQAFEIKRSPRRISGRTFHEAYGVAVQPIYPDNPFAGDIVK
jgi:hypothetical protein